MSHRKRGHPELADCDYEQGYWLYQDEDKDEWIAFRKFDSISASGETKRSAIGNAKDCLENHYGVETTHWDMWALNCPECNGRVAPLQVSVDDPTDARVYCSTCDTVHLIQLVPAEPDDRPD